MKRPVKLSPTVRKIGKQEAIRHLIHCAVRMVAAQEDPFAIHLLVHSAEKMLMDVSQRTGKKLTFNWEDHLKNGKEAQFFQIHRGTYNYFKHADRDFDKEMSVTDIARLNLPFLYVCAENYRKLYNVNTDHMLLMIDFMQVVAPQIFDLPNPKVHQEHLNKLGNATLGEFFAEGIKANPHLPNIQEEALLDRSDNGDLYNTPIPKLRETGLK